MEVFASCIKNIHMAGGWDGSMGRTFAAKPNNWSSTPGVHMMEGENPPPSHALVYTPCPTVQLHK